MKSSLWCDKSKTNTERFG